MLQCFRGHSQGYCFQPATHLARARKIILASPATTGLVVPIGLAFDTAGDLCVSNALGNTIRRFSPTGTDLGNFASSGLSNPTYIAFRPEAQGAVPEPSSLAMFITAMLGGVSFVWYQRCRGVP
jgi:hypothetical protein